MPAASSSSPPSAPAPLPAALASAGAAGPGPAFPVAVPPPHWLADHIFGLAWANAAAQANPQYTLPSLDGPVAVASLLQATSLGSADAARQQYQSMVNALVTAKRGLAIGWLNAG